MFQTIGKKQYGIDTRPCAYREWAQTEMYLLLLGKYAIRTACKDFNTLRFRSTVYNRCRDILCFGRTHCQDPLRPRAMWTWSAGLLLSQWLELAVKITDPASELECPQSL